MILRPQTPSGTPSWPLWGPGWPLKMRLHKRLEGEYHDTRAPDPFRDPLGSPRMAPDLTQLVSRWPLWGPGWPLKMRLQKCFEGEYHDTRAPSPVL